MAAVRGRALKVAKPSANRAALGAGAPPGVAGPLREVDIGFADARSSLAHIIRRANDEHVLFRITNARNAAAPAALVVSPEVWAQATRGAGSMAPANHFRTGADILARRPFARAALPVVQVSRDEPPDQPLTILAVDLAAPVRR